MVTYKIFLSTPSVRRATLYYTVDTVDWGFLSTPSVRRATIRAIRTAKTLDISIHALREEGDRGNSRALCRDRYFYPRPPRGGRQQGIADAAEAINISIRALREKGDQPAKP